MMNEGLICRLVFTPVEICRVSLSHASCVHWFVVTRWLPILQRGSLCFYIRRFRGLLRDPHFVYMCCDFSASTASSRASIIAGDTRRIMMESLCKPSLPPPPPRSANITNGAAVAELISAMTSEVGWLRRLRQSWCKSLSFGYRLDH